MRIVLFVFITGLLFVGCEEKKDDEKAYTTCEIVNSTAVLSENKERDERQCWTGGTHTDQGSASTWCTNKAKDWCSGYYSILGCTQTLTVKVSNDGC